MTLYANATVANNGCINPGNAHGAPDGSWTGNDDNSEDWDCRWGMENPSGDLADTQDIQVTVRKNASGGNGDPTVTIELWESGTQITTLQGSTAISSTTGVQVGGTFDASVLSDASGAGIQVRVVSVGVGGMPAGRRSIQVDGITFEEQLDALPALAPTLLTPTDTSITQDPTFTWQFNTDNTGETQAAFAFRRTYNAVDEWWDGSAWVGTETWIESATESVTIPVSEFPANEAVQWTVATRETTNGLEGPYATPWEVTISVLEAPTLVSPAEGADHDGQDFSWEFNQQALGGTQTEYAFMREDGEEITTTVISPVPSTGQSGEWFGSGPGHKDYMYIRWFTGGRIALWSLVENRYIARGRLNINLWNRSLSFNNERVIGLYRSSTSPIRIWDGEYQSDPDNWVIPYDPTQTITMDGQGSRQGELSNDHSKLAVTDNQDPAVLRMFDTTTWDEVISHVTLDSAIDGVGVRIAWSPNDALLVFAIAVSPYIVVYDTATWAKVSGPTVTETWSAATDVQLVFSPNGDYLAAIKRNIVSSVYVYNTSDWSVRFQLTFPNRPFRGNFSPTSEYLAVTAGSDGAYIFNMSDGSIAFHLEGTNQDPDNGFNTNDYPIAHADGFLLRGLIITNYHSLMLRYNTWEKEYPPPHHLRTSTVGDTGAEQFKMTLDGEGIIITAGVPTDALTVIKSRSDWSIITKLNVPSRRINLFDNYLMLESVDSDVADYHFFDPLTYQEVAAPWDITTDPYRPTETPRVSTQRKYFIQTASDSDTRVIVRETDTWTVVFDEDFTSVVLPVGHSYYLSDEHNLLFMGFIAQDTDGVVQKLYIYDTTTWTEITDDYPKFNFASGSSFSRFGILGYGALEVYDNNLFVSYRDDDDGHYEAIAVYDMTTWSLIGEFPPEPGVGPDISLFAISDAGLLAVAGSGIVSFYDAKTLEFFLEANYWVLDATRLNWIKGKNNENLLALSNTSNPYNYIGSFNAEERQWWNGTAWQDTEVYIASSDEQVTLPLGAWLDD